MHKTISKSILSILVLSLGVIWGQETSRNTIPAIELDVFSGAGSILLTWAADDSIQAESTTIWKSTDPAGKFSMISGLDSNETRYLDRDTEPGTHYFYRVEMVLEDDQVITSPIDTPPFSASLHSDPVTGEVYKDEAGKEISLASRDYFQTILEMSLYREFPEIPDQEFHKILDDSNSGNKDREWFEIFELESFTDFSPVGRLTFGAEIIQTVELLINDLEPSVRNNLMMTPDEWNSDRIDFIEPLAGHFAELTDKYQRTADLLSRCAPVHLTTVNRDTAGNFIAEISVLAHDGIEARDILVRTSAINLPVDQEDNLEFGFKVYLDLGSAPGWIELEYQGIVLQEFYMGESTDSIICSVNDEYFKADTSLENNFQVFYKIADPVLNEVGFDFDASRIMVEIAPSADSTSVYGIFIGDSLVQIAEHETHSSKFQVFNFDAAVNGGGCWVGVGRMNSDETWELMEFRPLNFSSSGYFARIPDGKQWTATDFATPGESNSVDKPTTAEIQVPEVFALYQNYPNPFNATTTISFDLLQPANVNLFITDATGRKIDVFMDDIPTDAGYYQFTWDGRRYSSGVYFFTIQAQVNEFLPVTFSRKMIYLK